MQWSNLYITTVYNGDDDDDDDDDDTLLPLPFPVKSCGILFLRGSIVMVCRDP